jgi:hypothetical protein
MEIIYEDKKKLDRIWKSPNGNVGITLTRTVCATPLQNCARLLKNGRDKDRRTSLIHLQSVYQVIQPCRGIKIA